MVIIVPVPKDFGRNLAKVIFGYMFFALILTLIGMGISFLVDGNIVGGLVPIGIGIVLLTPLIIWLVRRIKEHREYVKEYPNERIFSKQNLFNKRLVIFLTFTSVLTITVGVLLITSYGYLSAGIPTIIGGVIFLVIPILALVQKLSKKDTE